MKRPMTQQEAEARAAVLWRETIRRHPELAGRPAPDSVVQVLVHEWDRAREKEDERAN